MKKKIKLFITVYYSLIVHFTYLIKSNLSLNEKFQILFKLLTINFKYFFLSKLFNLKSEKIFGYKVYAFDYWSIRYLFEEIFYKNQYLFISRNPEPLIFDCGANIGLTIIYFKWLYPNSVIYAFEPDKITFELLKKNVEQNNFSNVHLFNSAISNKNGQVEFFVDNENPGSLLMSKFKERNNKDKTIVDSISLTNFIRDKRLKNIDLVKMDVEGSEFEVIEDLYENDLLKEINKFYIEYHHKIEGQKSKLSTFLLPFEKNGFEYQIDTRCVPLNSENKFQDVIIYLY